MNIPAAVPKDSLPSAASTALLPGHRAIAVSVVGTFLILAIGAMYYARGFFLPVILAILLTLILEPLVRVLAKRGIPTVVSVILIVVMLGGSLVVASASLSGPLSQVILGAPEVVQKLRERFAFIQGPLAILSDASKEVQKIGDGGDASEPETVVVSQPGLLTAAAGTLADIGTTLGATLILAVFLLASGNALRTKLIHTVPNLSDKKRSLRVLLDIEGEVSRYLLTITAINVGVGFCVGLAMAFFGMPNPILWGIAATLLNFIPFVGNLLGQILVFAVAVVTFPTLTEAVLPTLAYVAIGVIEGSFITPMILGRRLELNPVAILIFLALTTWMWGLVGAIIGVPILIVIKVFSGHYATLGWLAEFLSGEIAATADDDPTPALTPATKPGSGPNRAM